MLKGVWIRIVQNDYESKMTRSRQNAAMEARFQLYEEMHEHFGGSYRTFNPSTPNTFEDGKFCE